MAPFFGPGGGPGGSDGGPADPVRSVCEGFAQLAASVNLRHGVASVVFERASFGGLLKQVKGN